MKSKTTYKAIFENKSGSREILIKNDFETLSFELDEFKFEGTSFDDFEILSPENYSTNQLKDFDLNKISSGNGYVYEICDYKLSVFIPIELIDLKTNDSISTELKMYFELGKSLKSGRLEQFKHWLVLTINDKLYKGKGDLFEIAMNQILEKIDKNFKLKNCFGCSFSDYSVYGQNTFGNMLCYKNQKKEYLKVKTKDEFMNLKLEDRLVQETYSCKEFEIRKNNVGYRG